MVRSLHVKILCDLCPRAATHVDVRIGINSRRQRSLDLCHSCYEDLIRPVVDALEQHGYDATRATRRQNAQHRGRAIGPYLCKAGCASAPLKNRTTLQQHLRGLHSMELVDYVEQYGELVPLTPEELAELNIEAKCPEEGCDQVYSTELGNRYPQIALQSHMWGHHGIKWKQGASV